MSTTERVTVTLSSDLVEEIDLLERNRSRFIAEAVQHELTRRRREALLRPVQNPHPETEDLVDPGLRHRTADLPEDDPLVDLAEGTAVRWVEGRGWVKEPTWTLERGAGVLLSGEPAGIDHGLELFLGLGRSHVSAPTT